MLINISLYVCTTTYILIIALLNTFIHLTYLSNMSLGKPSLSVSLLLIKFYKYFIRFGNSKKAFLAVNKSIVNC